MQPGGESPLGSVRGSRNSLNPHLSRRLSSLPFCFQIENAPDIGEQGMRRRSTIGGSLMLVVASCVVGCPAKDRPKTPDEKSHLEPEIGPKQARAALLALDSLRAIKGGKDDPVFLDVKRGEISRMDGSTLKIGKFITCDPKQKTWQMSISNGPRGRLHYSEEVQSRVERKPDGSWRAIRAGGYVS